MSKYIQADKLIAEIKRRRDKCADIAADEDEENTEYYRGKEAAYDDTFGLIVSLMQEQPHWKPIKQQMKALNAVANEGVLLDLFNDLLKLL